MGICKICDKEFKDIKGKSNIFCSLDCYRVEQRNGAYKRGSNLKYKCTHCDKDVIGKSKSSSRNGNKSNDIFCDRKCYDKYRAKKILDTERECNQCSKKYIPFNASLKHKRGFCSDKCRKDNGYYHVVKKHGIKGISDDGNRYIKECMICSKDFLVDKQNASKKICSHECQSTFYKTDEQRKQKISKAFQGENHPNYVNGCSYNGRVRKTDMKERFSKDDKKSVLRLFEHKCFVCGADSRLTIDHHIPFSRGGRLTIANSVVLCLSCNSKKNAKMPEDFYTEKQLSKLSSMGIRQDSLFSEYV